MLWEEFTSKNFEKARELAKGTCVIPFGVIEKHGQHLPLGTDMYAARKFAIDAAEIEPVVIFPYYFFGQINEARHVPGTIAVTPGIMYSLLEEICNEISRNGFKKIIILNSHGGNYSFVNYFIESTLYAKRDYMIYNVSCYIPEEDKDMMCKSLGTDDWGSHAGNMETSMLMAIEPELVKMDEVEMEGINSYGMLSHLQGIGMPVTWYGNHPTHAAWEPFKANPESGRLAFELSVKGIAKQIKAIKEDDIALQLQKEFYSKTNE